MKQTLLVANVMLAAALLAAQKTPESMLGAALHQEEVQGDLKSAIAAYQKVVAAPGVGRKTAAQALVRMGQCYEKLGDRESRKAYERVLRDYADQKEPAAVAQTRLAALRVPVVGLGGMVARQIWASPKIDLEGTISPDGRYLSFHDPETGNLAMHDFTTAKDQLLTNKSTQDSNEHAEDSAISRDGKQVAYTWFNGEKRYDLRVLELTAGPAKPRVVYTNEEIDWIGPYDWSPDGNWIAVRLTKKDRTVQIGIVSATDGRLRVLKSVGWRGFSNLLFSPDGKLLAYDLAVADDTDQRDIFLLAANGSTETRLITHPADDTVLAWTPDGRHLLFASDRGGARGMWALPVRDGKPQSAPKLIKPDIGEARGRGFTRMGALYLGVRTDGPDVYIASIDFQTGKLLAPPAKPIHEFVGSNRMPAFSRDGKFLAYQVRKNQPSNVVGIQTLETGKIRHLRLDLAYFQQPEWSPDCRSIGVIGTDNKGRRGIFKADVETGAIAPVVLADAGVRLMWQAWTPDGTAMYFQRVDDNGAAVVVRDLASGKEREIVRQKGVTFGRLSPDGSRLILIADRHRNLKIVPVDGGEPREILRLQDEAFWQVEWSPDGKSLIAMKSGVVGRQLLRIPVDGGRPQKIELNADRVLYLNIHPDGRRIAFTNGYMKREVWAIENFLPILETRR